MVSSPLEKVCHSLAAMLCEPADSLREGEAANQLPMKPVKAVSIRPALGIMHDRRNKSVRHQFFHSLTLTPSRSLYAKLCAS